MKPFLPLFALTLLAQAAPLRAADDYPITEDSKAHADVPKGEVLRFAFEKSKIFPGTRRDVSVYVPRQYDGVKPACVYVNQDGVQWNAPTVFDNLIARNEMPVTIGVFVTPGVVPAANPNALPRFNRSLEYDGLGPDYVNFLLNELLPTVETMKTGDGRAIVLSKNGNDRAIGGSSSGAIAAFTAAWERPDAFSRVFSTIGTYVGLRGGNEYPTLIRKFEPKPLRVFLQDGSADQNIYGGDWWMANQEMERALTFAGYEVNHAWGEGGHSGAQGTQLFPDAMRWLWKGWPEPVKAGQGSPQLKEILIPGEEWTVLNGELPSDFLTLSVNSGGEVFAAREYGGDVFQAAEHSVKAVPDKYGIPAFGANGRMYLATNGQITAYDNGITKSFGKGLIIHDLVVRSDGSIYALADFDSKGDLYKIGGHSILPDFWQITPTGEKKLIQKAEFPQLQNIALSPDQTLLYASNPFGPWIYSYQIQPDGTLAHKQKYYRLHVPNDAEYSQADGMCVDRDGRLYVATAMGIQVCDQAGRVNSIIPVPGGAASSVVLGGADFDMLFVAAGGKIYKRKVKTKGAPSFLPPIKPDAPRL